MHNPDDEYFQVSEGSDDEAEEPYAPPSFPELELKVKESIEYLGGAPKGSAWISISGTLRCTNFNEVVLLFHAFSFT